MSNSKKLIKKLKENLINTELPNFEFNPDFDSIDFTIRKPSKKETDDEIFDETFNKRYQLLGITDPYLKYIFLLCLEKLDDEGLFLENEEKKYTLNTKLHDRIKEKFIKLFGSYFDVSGDPRSGLKIKLSSAAGFIYEDAASNILCDKSIVSLDEKSQKYNVSTLLLIYYHLGAVTKEKRKEYRDAVLEDRAEDIVEELIDKCKEAKGYTELIELFKSQILDKNNNLKLYYNKLLPEGYKFDIDTEETNSVYDLVIRKNNVKEVFAGIDVKAKESFENKPSNVKFSEYFGPDILPKYEHYQNCQYFGLLNIKTTMKYDDKYLFNIIDIETRLISLKSFIAKCKSDMAKDSDGCDPYLKIPTSNRLTPADFKQLEVLSEINLDSLRKERIRWQLPPEDTVKTLNYSTYPVLMKLDAFYNTFKSQIEKENKNEHQKFLYDVIFNKNNKTARFLNEKAVTKRIEAKNKNYSNVNLFENNIVNKEELSSLLVQMDAITRDAYEPYFKNDFSNISEYLKNFMLERLNDFAKYAYIYLDKSNKSFREKINPYANSEGVLEFKTECYIFIDKFNIGTEFSCEIEFPESFETTLQGVANNEKAIFKCSKNELDQIGLTFPKKSISKQNLYYKSLVNVSDINKIEELVRNLCSIYHKIGMMFKNLNTVKSGSKTSTDFDTLYRDILKMREKLPDDKIEDDLDIENYYSSLDDLSQSALSLNQVLNQGDKKKSQVLKISFDKVYNNIIKELKNNKKVSGSEPEERYYHWSSQEKDFMFDKPGLTTWEKDRQRVKEYLKSMGMLK